MLQESELPGPSPSNAPRRRRRLALAAVLVAVVAIVVAEIAVLTHHSASPGPYPAAAPTTHAGGATPLAGGGAHPAVCGDQSVLAGPATPPAGAVRVDTSQNLETLTDSSPAGTTFWLAPGVHILGNDQFNQVVPKDGNVYIGAPGAVFDGRRVNRFAFTQLAANVTVRNLTITHFGPTGTNPNEGVVNHDSGTGWTVEFDTIVDNAGAGVMIGSDDTVRANCLTGNGQYGFSMFSAKGVHNATLTGNEISANSTDGWEERVVGCGCTGGGKIWGTDGAVVTGNWVHDNRGVGLWADGNNVNIDFENNAIENSEDEGIVYEISYNGRIAHNTLTGNAIVLGKEFAARGDNFPVGAIYVSEAGGDPRLDGGKYATFEITSNTFVNNWGGVVLWENSDRFCGSTATNDTKFCTLGGAANLAMCVPATIGRAPYLSDCRWKTQNVSVDGNMFSIDRAAIGCHPSDYCGEQGLLANFGTQPAWSPYKGRAVQDAIVYHQNNRFFDNAYQGDWRFDAYETGNLKGLADWQSTYHQDQGSHTS